MSTETPSGSICERITVVEKLLKYVEEHLTKIVSRKRNGEPAEKMAVAEVECPSKSRKRSEEDFGLSCERKKSKTASDCIDDVEVRNEVFDEHLATVTERVVSLGVTNVEARSSPPMACKKAEEIESREQSLRRAHESLIERERKVDEIVRTLEGRIIAIEQREEKFNSYVEEKTREIASTEENLRLKLEGENRRKQQELKDAYEMMERLKSAEIKVECLRENLEKSLVETECRESVTQESASVTTNEGELIMVSLEKRMEELEKMRIDFSSFRENRIRDLELKEQLLLEMNEKSVMDIKLRSEELNMEGVSIIAALEKKFQEFEKTRSEFDSIQELKRIELETKELQLNAISEKNDEDARECDSMKVSIKEQLEVFEKMKNEFHTYQEKKMEDLYSKEKLLNDMSQEIAADVKIRNETLIAHEMLGHQLLKRLGLAKENVEGLKDVVDQRFKMLVSKQNDVNSTSDWVEKRLDEADHMAKKMEEKLVSIRSMEDNVRHKKHKLREREKELELWEQDLHKWKEELKVKQKQVDSAQELNKRVAEKLDAREKSMRELTGKCFKEHQAKKKELVIVKDLAENVVRFLGLEDENLNNAIRKLEIGENHQYSTDDHVVDGRGDLKFTVRMDGKNLQMFLNDPKKDLDSMGDEIFKVLHLSLDPAKLVLDAMEGFYPPHLRNDDATSDVRRTCIALLKQLLRISRVIKPCVGEEAMQVALAWKSNMAETPSVMEALGFLLLLRGYNIASSFDKDDISPLQTMVYLHRQETLHLDRFLDLTETLTGPQIGSITDVPVGRLRITHSECNKKM